MSQTPHNPLRRPGRTLLLALVLMAQVACSGLASHGSEGGAGAVAASAAPRSCVEWRAVAVAAIQQGDLVAARSACWNAMLMCRDPRERADLAAELERIEAAAIDEGSPLLRADPVLRYRDKEREHALAGNSQASLAAGMVAEEYARERAVVASYRP